MHGDSTYVCDLFIYRYINHPFSTYANFSKKTNIFYPLICRRTRTYQVVKNVSFSEIFAYVLNGWSHIKSCKSRSLCFIYSWDNFLEKTPPAFTCSNVWNLFKVNNKDTKTTSLTVGIKYSSVSLFPSIVHVSALWERKDWGCPIETKPLKK